MLETVRRSHYQLPSQAALDVTAIPQIKVQNQNRPQRYHQYFAKDRIEIKNKRIQKENMGSQEGKASNVTTHTTNTYNNRLNSRASLESRENYFIDMRAKNKALILKKPIDLVENDVVNKHDEQKNAKKTRNKLLSLQTP